MNSAKRRILLTGASGTLGRNFLEQEGANPRNEIMALLRKEVSSTNITKKPSVYFKRINFMNCRGLAATVHAFQPHIIIHCAATGMEFPKTEWFDLIRFNVNFSVNLCQIASEISGCRFIFISTGMVYRSMNRPLREDDPLDVLHPYGASKAAADLLIRAAAAEFEVPLTVLRPFSFTGLGDNRNRLFPSLLRAALEKKEFHLSSGLQKRDHCSALDIANGIIASMNKKHLPGEPSRIFNLGSGCQYPLRLVIEQIVDELEIPVQLVFGERSLGKFEPEYLVADITSAEKELDWMPKYNLAYAVWQLARESFPALKLKRPSELR